MKYFDYINHEDTEFVMTDDCIEDIRIGKIAGKYCLWINQLQQIVNFSGVIFTNETKYTFKNGNIHSYNNKPAIKSNQRSEWFLDGVSHRDNGPAKMYSNLSTNSYYLNGVYMRNLSTNSYYLNGVYMSYDKYIKSIPPEESIMVAMMYG